MMELEEYNYVPKTFRSINQLQASSQVESL